MKELHNRITKMNPNHFKTLSLYGNYTKFVLNNEEESQKLLSKASYIKKSSGLGSLSQTIQDKRLKFGDNSNFVILICSGNESTIGKIKGFNYNALQKFGYSYDELKNQNVEILMPKILSERHDFFMRRYFQKNKASVMGNERAVFPMDRNGFMMSSSLLIKVIPNLDMDLRILGLITPNAKEFNKNKEDNLDMYHLIMYHTTIGTVYGISKGCYYEFGIRPDFAHGRRNTSNILNIADIFPNIGELSQLKNHQTVGE